MTNRWGLNRDHAQELLNGFSMAERRAWTGFARGRMCENVGRIFLWLRRTVSLSNWMDCINRVYGAGDRNRTQLRPMGISTVSLKVSAESRAQLGRKTPPLRYEFRESWRVRPTDLTGLMVGAVGIEFASLTSKSRQRKALPTALHSNC